MKRLFDFIVVVILSLVLIPIMIPISFVVWFKFGFPILFKQPRPGLNGKIFNIFKFRTMTNELNKKGILLSDKNRLTKFGQFLRSTSLDELPGLYNVFVGDMSLVGPRPLLVEYLPLYSLIQARRHEVRPGITGWAQVNGRNSISWNKKFEMDVWYVDNQTLWLDIKILWITVKKVIMRKGISQKNHLTMKKFKGNS